MYKPLLIIVSVSLIVSEVQPHMTIIRVQPVEVGYSFNTIEVEF